MSTSNAIPDALQSVLGSTVNGIMIPAPAPIRIPFAKESRRISDLGITA